VRFRLVETGKSYAEQEKSNATTEIEVTADDGEVRVAPIIWETGNVNQIRSLLVLREAELVLAKSQLAGNRYNDWSTHNRIRDLEIKITDLRRWLNDTGREDSNSLGISAPEE